MKKVPSLTKLKRYNSYEKDPNTQSATETEKVVKKEVEKRIAKTKKAEKESKKFTRYKIHGKKKSRNLIIGWGSTKGAILDAIKNLDCKFLQILYLEPFPKEIKKELEKADNVVLIENNASGYLGDLIRQKTGFEIRDKNKILKYTGREFLADELNKEIEEKLK